MDRFLYFGAVLARCGSLASLLCFGLFVDLHSDGVSLLGRLIVYTQRCIVGAKGLKWFGSLPSFIVLLLGYCGKVSCTVDCLYVFSTNRFV